MVSKLPQTGFSTNLQSELPSLSTRLRGQDLRSPGFTKLSRGVPFGWLRVIVLLVLDCGLLGLARTIAEAVGTPVDSVWSTQINWLSLLVIVAVEVGCLAARRLYKAGEWRCDYVGVAKAISLGNGLIMLIAFLYRPGLFVSRSTFLLCWFLSILFVSAGRFAAAVVLERVRQHGAIQYPVFVFSDPQDADKATALLKSESHYRLMGWADIASLDGEQRERTIERVCAMQVSEVCICPRQPIQDPMFLFWSLRNAGVTLHFLPIAIEPLFRRSGFSVIGGVPSFKFAPPLFTGIDFWVKRAFDFCFAVLFLLLFLPVYIAIAILIKLDSPGPIFYRQTRVGLHSQPFKVWKFRSMVINAAELQKKMEILNETKDGILFKIKDDPRVTRVGKFIRQYSLDELPQIFNVLLGEMSLVGPRPLPLRDVENFSKRHFIRQEVLPGITGMWQVSGRSNIDNFEEVLNLDVNYIENWSLWLDLKIILQTAQVVLRKTGAY